MWCAVEGGDVQKPGTIAADLPPGQSAWAKSSPGREASRSARGDASGRATGRGSEGSTSKRQEEVDLANKAAEEAAEQVLSLRRQLESEQRRGFEGQRRVRELLEQLAVERERANDFKAFLEQERATMSRLEKVMEIGKGRPGFMSTLKEVMNETDPEDDPRNFTFERGFTDLMGKDPEQEAAERAVMEEERAKAEMEEKRRVMRELYMSEGLDDDPLHMAQDNLISEEEQAMMDELAKGAMTDQEFVTTIKGELNCHPVKPRLAGEIFRSGAPRGESRSQQYSWILCMSLPNPRWGELSEQRPGGIYQSEAALIYDLCFKAEDTVGNGSLIQDRFKIEKGLFLEAFVGLPEVANDKPASFERPRRFAGEEPMGSPWWHKRRESGLEPEKLAMNFCELLRNVMITKLTMHCQLPGKLCATEDETAFIMMITATETDLLKEADKEGFPCEMNARAVDPVSLEPCCPKTFYPLLDFFLRRCKGAPVSGVAKAYRKVMEMIAKASELDKRELAKEVDFWTSHENFFQGLVQKQRFSKAQAATGSFDEGGGLPATTMCGKICGKLMSRFDPSDHKGHAGRNHVRDEDHLYKSLHKRRTCVDAFIYYLNLKAERGLRADPIELMKEANAQFGGSTLKNWHELVGFETVANPYRPFTYDSYVGEDAKKWYYKQYATRSRKVDHYISSPFHGNARSKLLFNIINRQLDIAQLNALGFITSIFPLDSMQKIFKDNGPEGDVEKSELYSIWGVPDEASLIGKGIDFCKSTFKKVPLEEARQYYGERVAFYFALVETLSWWLVFPGLLGIVTTLFQRIYWYDPRVELPSRIRVGFDILYAGSIAVWGTLVLERWKRRQVTLAFLWGQRGTSKNEGPRPNYQGITRRDPVSYHNDEIHYHWKRRLKWQILSFSVFGFLMCLELTGTVITGRIRGRWVREGWPFAEYAQQCTALIEDVQMTVCKGLGFVLGKKLNDLENLRTNTDYINGLIHKVVVHELFNRFHLYFYVAFYKALSEGCVVVEGGEPARFMSPEEMDGKMCLTELTVQVYTVLLVEFGKNFMELLKPFVMMQWNNRNRPAPPIIAVDEAQGVTRMAHICQEAVEKPLYGPSLEVDGTFEDYLEIMILLGHFTLFSLVFPLAPALGWVLITTEIRVDGFKLFELVRRPLPINAEDIGYWYHVVAGLSWLSMFTNSALVVFTFGSFDNPPGYFGNLPQGVYFVFLFGALAVFKFLCGELIPDEPESVIVAEEHFTWLLEKMHEDLQVDPYANKPAEVDLACLDLSVDNANTGQWRAPEEFGMTIPKLEQRVRNMKLRKRKKGQEEPTTVIADLENNFTLGLEPGSP